MIKKNGEITGSVYLTSGGLVKDGIWLSGSHFLCWTFIFSPIFLSILFTWIYNNANRSTLSAILFHFMCNFSGNLIPLTEQGRLYSLILIIILSMVVTLIFGPKTLTHIRAWQMKSAGKGILRRFLGKRICRFQISFWLDFPYSKAIWSIIHHRTARRPWLFTFVGCPLFGWKAGVWIRRELRQEKELYCEL